MNSRFAVAVHTLAVLAWQDEMPVSSEVIARSVNTNPVVIRRLIASLREAGLVTAQAGRGGGFFLGRAAKDITLMDVYRAVEERELIPIHEESNRRCPVGSCIDKVLLRYTTAAEKALEESLSRTTIQNVVASIRRQRCQES
ncbi:MAG TPA: Rrf2 family transcriptional regulator [Thermoanaerobaculia bacterium]|nr:Rrf2 family transcriptional regulator [Thermoanaerobaculia bacterium]